jgi:N-acetylmuramoyl-L-alanine amidase
MPSLLLPLLLVSALLVGCATPVPAPPIVEVADWGGQPLAALPPAPQRISRITVHHQGEVWPAASRPNDDPASYLQRLQSWSRLTKRWVDIPYHYVIAPDGSIHATRDPAIPGDTNTEYDPRGHALLMLMGNFEVQQPTPAQLESAVALMAHLARRNGLDETAIASHKDYSTQTVCPGAALYARLDALRAAVRARLR